MRPSVVGKWTLHLDGGKLVEHGSRREPCGERTQSGAQRDVQTIGQEGDEDMRFDPLLQLVVDRSQPEIVLEGFETRALTKSTN